MMMTIWIGVAIITAILIDIAWEIRQIRMRLDRQGVQPSVPVVTQPTVTSWLATDALQAAQEQQQTRAANKIANAVRWR